jgi:ribonucleotide monophosphatase NagD (HAD superfamily)
MSSLRTVMQETFGITPEWVQYGKPSTMTFQYAQDLLLEWARREDCEISHFYMIGDNPAGDIHGANQMALTSAH